MPLKTAVVLVAALAAQNSTPPVPENPIPTIEGRWTGFYDGYEAEVKNGVITLTKSDPKKHAYLTPGTVLARLSNNGEADGSIYRFTQSSCLQHSEAAPTERTYAPCLASASLTRHGNGYTLQVVRFQFFRSSE